jgi:hypothetical protein
MPEGFVKLETFQDGARFGLLLFSPIRVIFLTV